MTDFDDPPRLADSAETPPELRNLLSSARSDVPDDNQVRRVAARLGPLLGLGAIGVLGQSALTAGGGAAQGGATATALTAVGVGKIAGVVLLGGALAGGAWWWSSAHDEQASPPAASVRPGAPVRASAAKVEPPAAPAATEIEPAVSASAPSAGVGRAQAEPTATARDAQATEAQLLQRARAALASDPALALKLTQIHKARFAAGQLAQEREVIAIDALERLNRGAEAKQRAGQFHSEFPDSVHQRKVDEIAK
jgi:hypothetical protein